MKAIFFGAIAASAFLTSSTVALAQSTPGETPDTGSFIKSRPGQGPAEMHGETTLAARLTLKEFGACTVKLFPTRAAQVIDMPYGTLETDMVMRRLASDDCLSTGQLRMSPWLLRGAIFEALYARQFGRRANPNFKAAPPFDYAAGYPRPISPDATNFIALARVGDCVTRTVPMAAHQLVTSVPGSQLESDSIATISHELAGCVPPKQTFKFSRPVIRASVAEALYRLSALMQRQLGVVN